MALVVAETIAAAKDAAELVDVTYEPLPAVVRAADAIAPGSPSLWDEAPDNVCIDIEVGDAAATAAAFARAAHVVRLDTWAQRVTGVPMEPRTIAADYDAASGCYTIYTGSGRGVAKVRTDLAQILGVPAERVRCVCGDMGGNFGTRNLFYPEYALLAWASRLVGRPVKWTCERSDSFLSDWQGRDLTVMAELALDAEGRFLAIRGSNLSNLGGHATAFGPLQKGIGLMSNVYAIPAVHFRGRGAVTNTVPTTPYRSAGRPEVIFVVERLVDLAADRLGIDPAELRRRNLIRPTAQPFTNPAGLTYDSGDYPAAMATGLALADWDGFPARRAEARRRGKWRGIGVANYIEITTGVPRERAEITVLPEGRVELVMGTMASGQGHETSFAQLVTEWLGVPFDSIDYIAHDTATGRRGGRLALRPLDETRRNDRRASDRRHHRQGEEDRGPSARNRRGRHRVRGRALPHRRHRSRDRPLRGRRGRGDAVRPAGGIAGAARRGVRPDPAGRQFSLWHADLRGRGRCRDAVPSRSSATPRSTMSGVPSTR